MSNAAESIKDRLREVIMSLQPQIIEIAPPLVLSNEAENNLRASLYEFFNASNPPAAMSGQIPTASLIGEPVPLSVFQYGSGDDDDVIGKGANEINTDLFVNTCSPIKGYILIVFSVEKLFRKCMRYTLMKSKIVDVQAQNQGAHMANLIGMTEDEFEFFGEDFLYNSVIDVHNLIGAYGRDTGVRSMVFNLGTVSAMGTIIYALKVPAKGFFHNYVLQLYENIESALYYSVLQQWAQWCNDAGEVQSNGIKYANRRNAIMAFRDVGCPRSTRPMRFY
jgi:hypothetical protein